MSNHGLQKSPLEIYASVILHSGCALVQEKHTWSKCPAQHVYYRIARKHQHKLKSNGMVIGRWSKREDLEQIRDRKGDYLGLLDMLLDEHFGPVSE